MTTISAVPLVNRSAEVMGAHDSPFLSPSFRWQHAEPVVLLEQKNGGVRWDAVQVLAQGVIALSNGRPSLLLDGPCDGDIDRNGNMWHNSGPLPIPSVGNGDSETRRILVPTGCREE